MPSSKPTVIVTRKLPEAVEARMAELFNARFNTSDVAMNHAALVQAAKDADVLVPTVTDRIDKSVILQAQAPVSSSSPISAMAWTTLMWRRPWRAASPSPTRRACSPKILPT